MDRQRLIADHSYVSRDAAAWQKAINVDAEELLELAATIVP